MNHCPCYYSSAHQSKSSPYKSYRFPDEPRAIVPQPIMQLQTPVSMLAKRLHQSSISLNGIKALASDLLQLPLLGKFLIETLQLLNELTTGADDGVLGSDGTIGLNTQFEAGK